MSEQPEPLLGEKIGYYLSISPELLEDSQWANGIPGMVSIALGTASPEEIAAADVRRAAWEAERARKQAAAIADWQQLRERHANTPAVLAVLDIHQPTTDGTLECQHPAYGYEADGEDWPCSTFEAIKGAVTP